MVCAAHWSCAARDQSWTDRSTNRSPLVEVSKDTPPSEALMWSPCMRPKDRTKDLAVPKSFLQAFKDTYLTDDIDGLMKLMAPQCEWLLIATAEMFRGTDTIRKLAERSKAARDQTSDEHLYVTDLFSSDDQMCRE